jgi:hypothetical protein
MKSLSNSTSSSSCPPLPSEPCITMTLQQGEGWQSWAPLHELQSLSWVRPVQKTSQSPEWPVDRPEPQGRWSIPTLGQSSASPP